MPVTAHHPRRAGRPGRLPRAAPPLLLLALTAVGAMAATTAAPPAAQVWTGTTAGICWLLLALATTWATLLLRVHRRRAERAEQARTDAREALSGHTAEIARLVRVLLPDLGARLADGEDATRALDALSLPSDPSLRAALHSVATALATAHRAARDARALSVEAAHRAERLDQDIETFAHETVPLVVARFAELRNHGDALHRVPLPEDERLRAALDEFAWSAHYGMRRAKVAYGMVRHSLTRVQARNATILHRLQDMQFRYGQEAFKDLFFLDETASRLALAADRIAWMVGGRGSRIWTRPIVMYRILRGAIGKIEAYRRVVLHCDTELSIVGRSAEAIMHLLAELIDNATQFSPPTAEVHVYAEERPAGIVVTIEDSGMKIPWAMREYVEDCLAGKVLDLADFKNHHYGFNVVGMIAQRFEIEVSIRPSSRGGTGFVVLLPSVHISERNPQHPALVVEQKLPEITAPVAPPLDRDLPPAEALAKHRAWVQAHKEERARAAAEAGTPLPPPGPPSELERLTAPWIARPAPEAGEHRNEAPEQEPPAPRRRAPYLPEGADPYDSEPPGAYEEVTGRDPYRDGPAPEAEKTATARGTQAGGTGATDAYGTSPTGAYGPGVTEPGGTGLAPARPAGPGTPPAGAVPAGSPVPNSAPHAPAPPPLPTRGPGTHGPLPSPRHQATAPGSAPYSRELPGEPDSEDPVPGFMERERFRADPEGARARFFGDDSGELFFDPLQGLGPLVSTENGLPVRPPGRTMAAVDQMIAELLAGEPSVPTPQQDVGRSFGGFDRAMRAGRAAREAATTDQATATGHTVTSGRSASSTAPVPAPAAPAAPPGPAPDEGRRPHGAPPTESTPSPTDLPERETP
ncbi:ATP-binding protein [Streptomyces sp. NRRL F-5630]|uniref:ATP-binding protein n=1 Tax=Streptomyces sp. NRRL F-5630 TaxID=1463864 RepID=UPI0004CB9453|nr:ATP-binding protein [Streptomyces sp. NRRL F-5630]